ncbi:ABC transporter ATP-binding protein [Microbacterium sp. bgisy189]|uniref:ABC transporter ATP-binding protein n=1 Tax=Microbacterium sp. bgisy189 TaxID=3413798 RepID=UPI003EBFE53B
MTTAASGVDAAAARAAFAPAPLLRVRDLGIRHDGAATATPLAATFDIAPGEVVLLLGPSGSGKSSLALALNGLIPQSIPATLAGSVTVAGRDAATETVAQLSTTVGMVFQDPDAQLVTGTLLDEVAFGPENLRMPVDEVLARAESALRRVGLWERRAENPDRLSGGGRQRLAIACALAMGSPLLVLDEPTANLDPAGIEDVYAALDELVRTDPNRAVLLIEHNLDAAITVTRRVVVLDAQGRTVADGAVDDVLRARAAELHEMGVWLPVSTIAALRLQRAGWRFNRLPLTPDELRDAVAAPASAPGAGAGAASQIRTDAADSDDSAASIRIREQSPNPVTGAPVVEVRGLTLQRGRGRHRATVLRDVDLTITAGEFVAVVGANGAGKTSLAQAIAGVVPVPKGTVRVGGVDAARADRRTLSRRVGFVFQNPEHQFIAHTVADEIAHGLRLQKLPDAEVAERTADLLTRFGLEQKAQQHPFLLSGGQKRRLSVGTALVAGAPVLVLDEPTFGQDRARADELLGLLRELNTAGTTIVVVTHDMQLVTEYATRTVIVGDGRIVADGTTDEVFAEEALILRAGLRLPPLARALHDAPHPLLAGRTRLADLPAPRVEPTGADA